MKTALKTLDMELTKLITRLPETWRGLFIVVTSLGDPIVTIGIGVVIVCIGWWQQNVRLALAGSVIWMTLITGAILKVVFSRARPMTEYAANLRVDTFSFPSGHSSGAMVAYGLLAYCAIHLLPQPYGWIVAIGCACIIVAVGVSRIYLGAHFPSDVLAGWILGALALIIIAVVIRPLS